MSECGTIISYLATHAAGAMADGKGFAPVSQEITNKIQACAGGLFNSINSVKSAGTPANQVGLSDSVRTQLEQLGNRDITGSGAFTDSTPIEYISTLGNRSLDTLNAHVNLMFGANPIQMAQTFNIATSFTNTSEQLAPTLKKLNDGVFYGANPNIDTLTYPEDGVFPNYLGAGYPDLLAVVTNGVSTLFNTQTSEAYTLLAQDLVNLGNAFNVQDIVNFGHPGQIIIKLNELNGLGLTGVGNFLSKANINIEFLPNLGSVNYNEITNLILEQIDTPELLSNAQKLLGSNVADMETLADYYNFDKVFKLSKDVIDFTSFETLRTKLQAIELGTIDTSLNLGVYINGIKPETFSTIGNRKSFVNRNYTDPLTNKFLGGSGPNGEVTFVDFIGLLGGAGIGNSVNDFITNMDALDSAGEFVQIKSIINTMSQILAGTFTTIVTPHVTGPPFVPADITIAVPNGGTHATYDSAIAVQIGKLEAELVKIVDKQNVESKITTVIQTWDAINNKVFKEKEFQSRIDMNYDIRTDFPDIAFTFIVSLNGLLNRNGRKEVIEGMINQAEKNGDEASQYVKAHIREIENKANGSFFNVRHRGEICE